MAKISVVVPVYNAEKTVERCVESIISNNYNDLEIILVEDCSKDNSLKKCIALSEKYSNVRYVHNEVNMGVSYTRNRGIYEATGTYTMFVDSDDWIDGNYFNLFNEAIDKYPNVLVICGYVNHDEKYNGITDNIVWSESIENDCFVLKDVLKEVYDKTLLQQLWNKMFITKIIQDNKLRFDESISIGEDLRFILEYIKVSNIKDVVFINKLLYHYMRDQEDSLMFKVGLESVEEPLKNLRSLYELVGYDKELIKKNIASDRQKQIELYAYLIMHNAGMDKKEKKRLILALDTENGQALYRKNRKIYFKEKISKIIKG
ncbi:MAG: glycosyltransferase family 2 protein [Eubacterium sp.]